MYWVYGHGHTKQHWAMQIPKHAARQSKNIYSVSRENGPESLKSIGVSDIVSQRPSQ